MDWLEEFRAQFEHDEHMRHLKRDEFHGYVQINFVKGRPANCNCNIHIRALKYKDAKQINLN